MLRRVRARDAKFRVETIRFVADPHIFSDVCELDLRRDVRLPLQRGLPRPARATGARGSRGKDEPRSGHR